LGLSDERLMLQEKDYRLLVVYYRTTNKARNTCTLFASLPSVLIANKRNPRSPL
jgi:hypothetical protein